MHVLEFCTSNFTFITMRSSVNSTLFVSFNEIIAPPIQDSLAIPETHRFTYDELKAITNNFDLVLGKGGVWECLLTMVDCMMALKLQ